MRDRGMNLGDRNPTCGRFATDPQSGPVMMAERNDSARVGFTPLDPPQGSSRSAYGGRSRERPLRNTARSWLPRITADDCAPEHHGPETTISGLAAAPDATALAMVLPQELHHFSRFHGGVDADRRRGFAVPPAVLADDHPTTVRPLHDFGMVDFPHRSTPRQPHSTLLTAQGWMPGRRRPPVGTRRFREPPVARYPTGRQVGDSGSANLVTGVKSWWSECSRQDSVKCRAPLAQYHQPAHSTAFSHPSTKHSSLLDGTRAGGGSP